MELIILCVCQFQEGGCPWIAPKRLKEGGGGLMVMVEKLGGNKSAATSGGIITQQQQQLGAGTLGCPRSSSPSPLHPLPLPPHSLSSNGQDAQPGLVQSLITRIPNF